ncbi:hypothetical protein [Paracoccus sp. (in: a-proteobacteria)]|uniref:phage tail tube protein n=1 Tax=Paracoccus sp. TaxID=267 RepID=UPI0026DF7915|nr:hypothetical protein [Paracoccus sp. (in: a-proteobacteria)]MDO5646302.1 hypothetical protein [Paracoccus sp. (in: a-proteobacteria)]
MSFENNYTLGRGRIYFARRDPNTGLLGGERYLGNTPEFNTNFESEELPHYSSDRGVREKDASAVLQINRTGSLITDNISPENVALFFFGTEQALTVAQTTVTKEQVGVTGVGVEKGMFYQLGQTAANPSGARAVIFPGASGTAFSVTKKGTATALVSGVDYVLDAALGRLEILPSSTTVKDGNILEVTYTVSASKRTRIISGSAAIEGTLRFVAVNPVGKNVDYYMPHVKLSPNGDYALKGDEWQQMPFTVEIMKPENMEALYADERAQTA